MDQLKNLTIFNINCSNLLANISTGSSSEILLKKAHVTLAIGFWMTGLLCIAGQLILRHACFCQLNIFQFFNNFKQLSLY